MSDGLQMSEGGGGRGLLSKLTCTERRGGGNGVAPAVGGYYDQPRASDVPIPLQAGAIPPIRAELDGGDDLIECYLSRHTGVAFLFALKTPL